MPDTIKFNSSSIEEKSLRKGNIYIGVGDVGKGPTSLTGFKGGANLGSNAYLISLHRGSGVFSHYLCSDDSELISKTNKIDTSVVRTTKEECFEYFASQSDKMVVNKDYEAIVTDGLVLNLDAGFLPSYPATGSSWYDLSGSGNNGTLVNGPTFSTDGGGSIVFDGVDDYVNLQNNSTTNITNNFTFTVVFSSNDISRASQTLFSKAESGGYGMEFNTGTIASAIGFLGYIDGSYRTVTDSISNYTSNRVYSLTATYDNAFLRLYRNGVQVNQASQTGNITTTTQPLCLGINPQASGPYVIPLTGNIYTFQIYNRALSVSEISQNYYKGPIVTDGLVFSFDSSNIISYPFTGTTAYSLTGSNNGTLVNGVAFSNQNGGTWIFDNSNDYIQLPSDLGYSTTTLSVFSWFKSNGQPLGNYHIICGGQECEISVPWPGGAIRTGVLTNTRFVSNHGSGLNDGLWHYIGFTYDGSTKRSYIDGVSVGTQVVTGTLVTSVFNRRLGRFGSSSDYYLNGHIASYWVYNSVISDSEVLQNFNAHRSRFGI